MLMNAVHNYDGMQYTIMMECKPCERENKSKIDVNECSTQL